MIVNFLMAYEPWGFIIFFIVAMLVMKSPQLNFIIVLITSFSVGRGDFESITLFAVIVFWLLCSRSVWKKSWKSCAKTALLIVLSVAACFYVGQMSLLNQTIQNTVLFAAICSGTLSILAALSFKKAQNEEEKNRG